MTWKRFTKGLAALALGTSLATGMFLPACAKESRESRERIYSIEPDGKIITSYDMIIKVYEDEVRFFEEKAKTAIDENTRRKFQDGADEFRLEAERYMKERDKWISILKQETQEKPRKNY